MEYTQDRYGTVFDRPASQVTAAMDLLNGKTLALTWTDELGCLIDVLLAFNPERVGRSGRIDAGGDKLYVGVLGYGAHAFGVSLGGYLAPDYFAEKVTMQMNPTSVALAAFVGGIMASIALLGDQ